MKDFDELFDVKGTQKFVDNAIQDFKFQYKQGEYYVGECFESTETIVSERVGCHQPSAVCHVFGITMEDLYGTENSLPQTKYDEVMQRQLWRGEKEWLPFDDYIDQIGFYDDIETILWNKYGQTFIENVRLYGGDLSLAWHDGEFALVYAISDEDLASLVLDEETCRVVGELYTDMEKEGK